MTHTQLYQIFIARRYASTVYIVLWPSVRPSVHLVRGRGTGRCQVVQRDPRRDVVIHASCYYRRAEVARSVHPCGLLLQARRSGAVCLSTRPIAIGAMVEQPGGQRTTCFSSFLTIFVSPIILTSTGRISRGCDRSVPLWL